MNWPEDYIDRVVCGDCLMVMKGIPDRGIDLVVTSLPYNVGKDYGEYSSDNRPDYDEWIALVLAECVRVASVALYVFICQSKMELIKMNLPGFAQWVFWHKPNLLSARPIFPWIPTVTPIAFAWTNGRQSMLNEIQGIMTYDLIVASGPQSNYSGQNKRCHVAQDPVDAYKPLIARTPGNIVLDPFLGSGTTAVAAKQLGRRYIGIEINSDYCKIAEERLKQEELFPEGIKP